MRARTVLAFIVLATLLVPILQDGEVVGASNGDSDGRALPAVRNDSIDISFEKNEYLEWNLSGNITINITITSKMDSDENITVVADYDTYYGKTPNIIMSSDLDRRQNVLLSAYEARILHVNMSVKPNQRDRGGIFFRMIYTVQANNAHINSQNSTTIVSYGPFSMKIVEPVPSMGIYHVLTDTPIVIGINVTNYSDKALMGSLRGGPNIITISMAPRSSLVARINISPSYEEGYSIHSFSLTIGDTETTIGFDMQDGVATNITDAYVGVITHQLLKIQIQDRSLELGVRGKLNLTVISGASAVLRNIHFKVDINGWLSEMISHRGELTIERIEPLSSVNVSYDITPDVSGVFGLRFRAVIQGNVFSPEYGLTIISKAVPRPYVRFSPNSNVRMQGGTVFINGTITNYYPYALRDVKLTVMLENGLSGFLSRDDFMTVRPSEMRIDVLESGQMKDFAFNITMSSPGRWKFGVVALWGGNASSGGNDNLSEYYISRPQYSYSLPTIIVSIAIVTAIPKIIDIVIRRKRRIGS